MLVLQYRSGNGAIDSTLNRTLTNPFGDSMGLVCDVGNTYAILGGYQNNSYSGKAFVFDGSSGNLLYTLNNPNVDTTSSDDWFGFSVAIDDTYAVVGAPKEEGPPEYNTQRDDDRGRVYVYNASTGNLLRTIEVPVGYRTAWDNFGSTVDVCAGKIAIGHVGWDAGFSLGSNNVGKVWVIDAATGNVIHMFSYPGGLSTYGNDNEGWGDSVAISENYLVAGAWDDDGGNAIGGAYIYNLNTGNLVKWVQNPNPSIAKWNDEFGRHVGITDEYTIVSSISTEEDAAYLFETSTGNLIHRFINPTGNSDDLFGSKVDVNGIYALIGARGYNSYRGRAYIFNCLTGNLEHILENPEGTSNNSFGVDVAISDKYRLITSTNPPRGFIF